MESIAPLLVRIVTIPMTRPIHQPPMAGVLEILAKDSPLQALVAARNAFISAATATQDPESAMTKAGLSYLVHLKTLLVHGGGGGGKVDALAAALQWAWMPPHGQVLHVSSLAHELILTYCLVAATHTHKYKKWVEESVRGSAFPFQEASGKLEYVAQTLVAAADFLETYPVPQVGLDVDALLFRAAYFRGLAMQCVLLAIRAQGGESWIPQAMTLIIHWERALQHIPNGEKKGEVARTMAQSQSMWRGDMARAMALSVASKDVYPERNYRMLPVPLRRLVRLLFLAASEGVLYAPGEDKKKGSKKPDAMALWFGDLLTASDEQYGELRSHFFEKSLSTHDPLLAELVKTLPARLADYDQNSTIGTIALDDDAAREELFAPHVPAPVEDMATKRLALKIMADMDNLWVAQEQFRPRVASDVALVAQTLLHMHVPPPPGPPTNTLPLVHLMQDDAWSSLKLTPREEMLMWAALLAERKRQVVYQLAGKVSDEMRVALVCESEHVDRVSSQLRTLLLSPNQ
jgi:hypothetical protein